MSRLWILSVLGLIALLGIACSDEDESLSSASATTVVATKASAAAPPTVAPSKTDPVVTPTPKTTLWRWGSVVLSVPDGRDFTVIRYRNGSDSPSKGPIIELVRGESGLIIDAETGEVLSSQVDAADNSSFDAIRATITVSEPKDRPWPYAQDEPADAKVKEGDVLYRQPAPETGLVVDGGFRDGPNGGDQFLLIESAHSRRFIDAHTGKVDDSNDQITPEDAEAFERWTKAVEVASS